MAPSRFRSPALPFSVSPTDASSESFCPTLSLTLQRLLLFSTSDASPGVRPATLLPASDVLVLHQRRAANLSPATRLFSTSGASPTSHQRRLSSPPAFSTSDASPKNNASPGVVVLHQRRRRHPPAARSHGIPRRAHPVHQRHLIAAAEERGTHPSPAPQRRALLEVDALVPTRYLSPLLTLGSDGSKLRYGHRHVVFFHLVFDLCPSPSLPLSLFDVDAARPNPTDGN